MAPPDPRFCTRCGAATERVVPPGDHRRRHVCGSCGFIHYLGPKVAAGTIPERDGKLLFIRRNIEPRKGSWSLPCGFMEIDETAEQAAVRETLEETGVEVRLGAHLGTYTYAESLFGGSIVIIVYRAEIISGTPHTTEEVSEIRFLAPEEIPWDELAFRSNTDSLRDLLKLKGTPLPC